MLYRCLTKTKISGERTELADELKKISIIKAKSDSRASDNWKSKYRKNERAKQYKV